MQRTIRHTRGGATLGVFFVLSLAALLSACATRPVVSPALSPQQRAAAWQAHQQALAGLERWAFEGRVAVKDTQQESWSASLRWRQRGDGFDIRLAGPFGQGAAQLSGKPGYAVIETSEHAALSASSAEALMQEQLGWAVPVQGFRHWLIGLPAPGVVGRHALDGAGRLSELEQDGWQIHYDRYQEVDGLVLPRKMTLENARLRVRLVIDDWAVSAAEADDVV